MSKKLPVAMRNAQATISKHSPAILTGIGIAGMVTTTVLAIKATPKAMMLIEERKNELNVDKLQPVEVVKTCWKPYLPTVITGAASLACIVGASSVSSKRNAAVMAAYEMSRTAMSEYKDKVVQTIGEKKEQSIRDEIAKDKVAANQPIEQQVILTEAGNTLCYDSISGRYFKSDINKLRKIENELSKRLRSEMYISLNEFYYEVGLPRIKIGDELGWNINDMNDDIELSFSSQLTSDDTPCLIMDYMVGPRYGFENLL